MRKVFVVSMIVIVMLTNFALADGFSENADAVELAAGSVLMLEVYDADNDLIATGSGFVAFDDQTIVTNYHVIEDGTYMIGLCENGHEYRIPEVLVGDKFKDIAICRFESPTGLTPLELNTDGKLKRAEKVVAIGSPKGIANVVSLGNISALYIEDGTSTIQFTAPVSNGSSGGALFDDEGRVIGVTSAIMKDAQNLNFAVHICEVADLYAKWDGHSYSTLTDYQRYGGNMKDGSGTNGMNTPNVNDYDCTPVTRRIMTAFDAAGLNYKYDGKDSEGKADVIRVYVMLENAGYVTINVFVDTDGEICSMYLWNLITYDPSGHDALIDTCMDLMCNYRYVRFYTDQTDNSVTAQTDVALFDSSESGELCVKAVDAMSAIVEKAYPELDDFAA